MTDVQMITFSLVFISKGRWTTRLKHSYTLLETGTLYVEVWKAGKWEEHFDNEQSFLARKTGNLQLAYRRAKNLIFRGQLPSGTRFRFTEDSPRTLYIDLDEDGNYHPYGTKVRL